MKIDDNPGENDMTSAESSPTFIGSRTLPPGVWTLVHIRGEVPGPTEADARVVTEVFHDNGGEINLAVYSDGAVRFEGDQVDYPDRGWEVRWVPFEESTYQQFVQSGR